MEIYKALDGDRLDKIVYKHYGHLKFFEQVLNINHQLTPVLKAGDIVYLPEFKDTSIRKENALW